MQISIRWRDSGESDFGDEVQAEIKTASDQYDFDMIHLYRLGAYQTRQYEFVFTENSAFSMAAAHEVLEPLPV